VNALAVPSAALFARAEFPPSFHVPQIMESMMTVTAERDASPLAPFPANFHFLLASAEEKDRFLTVVGELLAGELQRGAAATAKLNELIATCRAQQIRAWLDGARAQLRQMMAAADFIASHDEAQIARDLERTSKRTEQTEAALTKAADAHERATRDKDQAAAVHEQFQAARAQLATGDIVLCAAFQRVQERSAA